MTTTTITPVRRPTHAEALDYVQAVEASWGIRHGVQIGRADDIEDPSFPGIPMVRVRTYDTGNDWTVWIEPDGTIYGEC